MSELYEIEIQGGCYGEIRDQDYDTSRFHVHHLISKEAWNRVGDDIVDTFGVTRFNRFITQDGNHEWAPAILMEKRDHEQTRSFYRPDWDGREAREQIDHETEQLFRRGDVMGLLQEECDDIRARFGSKYNRAIAQMFASIRGQFRHQGHTLLIYDPFSGYYVKFRFG